MIRGVYVGLVDQLYGKSALLRVDGGELLLAQFDDMSVPEAFGWHIFPVNDFFKLED